MTSAAMLRAILFGLIALAGREAGAGIRCNVDAKFSCGPTGCEAVALGTTARIDFERQVYSRCDARGCDEYDALISQSGEFANVALPEHGMLAKLALSNGTFVEVATLGNDTVVSYGRCRAE